MLILHLAKQLRNIRQLGPEALGSSGLGEKISHEPWGIRCTRDPVVSALSRGAEVLLLYEPVPISPYAKMAKHFAVRGD
ncbi:MAG: hypothetical protein EOR78_27945 [Mesorhizobium sp.]|uniref:hypothetical protein n=1 Tax=Mesorhizobium sp. TaxID=1871066 RepID=UPI000FE60CEF|nr:hypothetical protein [Mesorhizobium sp.]RWA97934.1 MAG: hypothetical protein EOQ33_29550 [Mesorhizobium sp.]RWK59795.1 MAG: hypothetical protein EOR49_24745 [Mesorhizobium sp.]RWM44455.1 MAG: hypothetical protein EOR76_25140 [Mesorhizobium sp.]RWM49121.1 MAG: hypothetical protein EOR78_27945 [Mesorhizobium sp.]RWO23201.1 MAG: hypothetical protein EOS10_34050 [Mesorhizobium sp.]